MVAISLRPMVYVESFRLKLCSDILPFFLIEVPSATPGK